MSRSFKWYFLSGLTTKIFYIFWFSLMGAISLICLIHYLISIKIFDERYKVKFPPAFLYLRPRGSRHSPQHYDLNHPQSIYFRPSV
jgi:hypothetical protein